MNVMLNLSMISKIFNVICYCALRVACYLRCFIRLYFMNEYASSAKYRRIKSYEGDVEVNIHVFLISALVGGLNRLNIH